MKVIDFTVADDIRVEVDQKHTIVGVLPYDTCLTVAPLPGEQLAWPLIMKYGLFIRAMLPIDEPKPTNFKLIAFLNDKEFQKTEGKLQFPSAIMYINMALTLTFKIPDKGLMQFKLQFFDGEKLISEFKPIYNITIAT